MIAMPAGVRVWLANGHTDMRRGMGGLALQVQQALDRDPHAGDLYVFRGRRGQRPTFYIQFALCDDRLPVAPADGADVSGLTFPSRQRPEMHLHG